MRARFIAATNFAAVRTLAACGLLIVAAAAADEPRPRDDPLCSASLSVILENGTSKSGDDDVLYDDGLAYPAKLRWTDGNNTYGCVCRLRECVRKCCGVDEVLREDLTKRPVCERMPRMADNKTQFAVRMPELRLNRDQLADEIKHVGELREYFRLVEQNVCPGGIYALNPSEYEEDRYVLQTNGSLVSADKKLFPVWDYCLDWHVTYGRIGVVACLTPRPEKTAKEETAHHVGIFISIPFLLATFLVYAITPELKNLYGKTLMCYVICLITAYISLISANYFYISSIRPLCLVMAFVIHFSFLASFFWLNVMCFDIWWTFGGFRSLQGSVKQRERKKFIIYSIYAWGSASILTIVCAIMDFVPSVPKDLIRPEFGTERCWFTTDAAKAIYFYGPMSVTVICNICLFISTALKIVRHKKDTAHHLRGSESRRHDDNKQWFNLYLKLFIVMGINWSMEIVSWLFKSAPQYVWYLTDLTNTLQGVIIFIIFVWKKKIKRLLLKRFGQEGGMFSRNSTRTASRSCTTTTSVMQLQEKISPSSVQTNCRAKSSDETDYP